MDTIERITLNPKVMKGKPTIRNMRFSVAQMLELLAGGMTFEEILEDYPYLEVEDIQASLMYAARIATPHQHSPTPTPPPSAPKTASHLPAVKNTPPEPGSAHRLPVRTDLLLPEKYFPASSSPAHPAASGGSSGQPA
jgi:uncharacterized protein (DUF433 family)